LEIQEQSVGDQGAPCTSAGGAFDAGRPDRNQLGFFRKLSFA